MAEDKDIKHKAAMAKQKAKVDSNIERADKEQGVALLLTGNGKGKSSSAFGMVMRALGYGHKVGVVQFIKGQQLSGEEIYLKEHCPQVAFYQMQLGRSPVDSDAKWVKLSTQAAYTWPDSRLDNDEQEKWKIPVFCHQDKKVKFIQGGWVEIARL